jgi:hypothetical protein
MQDLAEIQSRTLARANEATSRSYPPERRLDAAGLTRFLDRRMFAVISTTRANGRPHATISSYVRRGTIFWLPTLTGSVRERNIQRQPWASLVITEGDANEHVVVIIEGPTEIVAPADVPADVVATTSRSWVAVWFRLEAQRVLSYAEGVEV